MPIETITLLAIFVPILGAFSVPLAGWLSPRARSLWAVVLGLATAAFAMLLIPFAVGGGNLILYWNLLLGVDFILTVDALSVFMSVVSSSVGAVILIYSIGYMEREEHQNEYYAMFLLFIGAMMGLVYSSNLIFLYLFWEVTAICSWRLIGFYRGKEHVVKADKAFLFTFGSAVVMLVGFLLIHGQTGTFDLTKMHGVGLTGAIVLLVLVGIFAKSATLPLHTWLPDAGVAPSTVTSMLHAAVLVKIGVYAYARLFNATFVLPPGWADGIAVLAMASSLVAACAAAVENDLKRILAYSTISQIGYIFLGLSVSGPIGIAGSLLYILMHGLGKAGLFLCAGIVEHSTHKRDIRELGGLIKTMPLTAAAFFLCAFSVIGIPPLGGFFPKFMVILGTVEAGKLWLAAAALLIAVLTAFYLFRLFHAVFLGDAKSDAREGTPSMLLAVLGLAAFSVAGGILVFYPMQLVDTATLQILGLVP
ncbi:MAG: NADH-quinone oxidoreductase subunit L [Anaerolineales bacterium]|nr:NADH-quinone oxidoreductase subunit L [Anaerolineales bacterium]